MDFSHRSYHGQRAIVIGGSIAGLTTALLLRRLGFEVDVFEKSRNNLDGRGGGIVLQPDSMRWFEEFSSQSLDEISTRTEWLQYLGVDNAMLHREWSPWRYTSWSTFHRALLQDFGRDRYHLAQYACGFDQDEDGVDVRFVDSSLRRAELVVIADGISSASRSRIDPDVTLEYSGYVGWRGTVPEAALTDNTRGLLENAITYSIAPHSHINLYPIPSERAEQSGSRFINYVWYRNIAEGPELDEFMTDTHGSRAPISVHPGRVQGRFVDEMRAAATEMLAPAAAEVVTKTQEPFVQAIIDVLSVRMSLGRVAMVGDAASAARPHAAAGTAKAAANAWSLYDVLAEPGESSIAGSLAKWEPPQLSLGEQLVRRVQEMGTRSQVESNWTYGDPTLRFGLYGPGR